MVARAVMSYNLKAGRGPETEIGSVKVVGMESKQKLVCFILSFSVD